MRSHFETPRSITASPPPAAGSAPGVSDDALLRPMDRHLTALGQRLDTYLAAIVRTLAERGVLTGSPHCTDPARRLIGSIVLDCTALRVAARTPADHRRVGARSLGAVHPDRPVPVNLTWDEQMGWSAGRHHDSIRSSRSYGSVRPITAVPTGRPSLRVLR